MKKTWLKIAVLLMASTFGVNAFAASNPGESAENMNAKEKQVHISDSHSTSQSFDKSHEGDVDRYDFDLAKLKAVISEEGESNGK